jgi:hypothetical protein
LLDIILDGGQEINIVLEDMYATNHKIISLAACIPVATILAGAYFFAKKGYAHSIYQPICTIIRDLNILLNRSLGKNNDNYVDGLVYFYAMQLSDFALLVPKKTALQLHEDIKDLKSITLNYQQKYNVILRMYHTYDFLFPGAL